MHNLKEVHVCCVSLKCTSYPRNQEDKDYSSQQELISLLSEALLLLPELQLLGHNAKKCGWDELGCTKEYADVQLVAMNPDCWRRIDRPGAEYHFRRVR